MGLLDGKVAIVTGAGNGVGRGEAIELADQGAKVVVNDLGVSVTGEGADKRTADEVVDVIKGRGGEAVANYDDVADFNGAKSIIDTAVEAFGKLDVLVNNAGILRDKMLFTMGEDEFDSVIRVHLKGTWSTMHHASAYWRTESKEGRQPNGSIVNTVSSAGLQGQASQSNYGAAKAGIAAMTIIASLELTRYGVRANCIGPGGFTRMVGQARQDITIKNPEEYTEFDGMNPGNSAPAVAWLASDDSKPTTGQVLRMVGNSLCVYQPWQMGEEFFATDNEGKPARWDAGDVGNILNKYVFHTVNPGIDRMEQMGDEGDDTTDPDVVGSGSTPFMFNDPGDNIGPKSSDLWKPVIAAVNGIACGGAFYMLGEVEFIIAAEHATFFDPHVSFGMTACFESMHMLQKMPFGEIMRVALLGASERMTAQRAHDVGLVSEVVGADALHDA